MDKINFGGKSVKNIPFGSRKEYSKQITHSLRKTVFSMRWAAAFYLGILKSNDEKKETYGLPSQATVPLVPELYNFCTDEDLDPFPMHFMQDGARSHTTNDNMRFLHSKFHYRIISNKNEVINFSMLKLIVSIL